MDTQARHLFQRNPNEQGPSGPQLQTTEAMEIKMGTMEDHHEHGSLAHCPLI